MGLGTFFNNLLKAQSGGSSLPTSVESLPFLQNAFGQYGIYPEVKTEDFQNTYQIQSTVYKCIYTISHNFASVPVEISKYIGEEKNILTDNPAFNVFKTYNPWQTGYDFWESVIGYLEMTGECFVLKLYQGIKIVALVVLRPDKIIVNPSDTELIKNYTFVNNGKRYTIPSNEILYLKYFNPTSDYRGLSPMKAALYDIDLDLKAVSSNTKTFENSARPSGVLTTEQQLGAHSWERFKKEFNEKYAGDLNKGKILFLDSGMTWKQIGLSSKDMQYMEQRKWSKDIIRQIYGVPPIYLMDFSDSSVLANAGIQETLLWTETIIPKQIKIASIINKWLISELSSDSEVKFSFDNSDVRALQPDRDQLSKRYKEGMMAGAITPNDIRENVFKLERSNDPSMDQHYISSSLIPIDMSSNEPKSPEPTKSQIAINEINKYLSSVESIKSPSEIVDSCIDFVEKTFLTGDDKIKSIKAKSVHSQIMNKFEKKFSTAVIGIFNKQKNRIVANLDNFKMFVTKFDPAEVNINISQWAKDFEKAGADNMVGAFDYAGGLFANELKGGKWNPADPNAMKYMKARTHKYAALVNTTTYNDINGILVGAIERGLTITQTKLLIRQYFTNNNTMRATRIARTELVSSANYGRMQSMLQNKIKYHRWVTMGDDAVRDSHNAVGGQIKRVGESFDVGAGYSGDPAFPSDINERCFTISSKKE